MLLKFKKYIHLLPSIYFWFSSMMGNVFSWIFVMLLGRGLSLSDFAIVSLYVSMQNFLTIATESIAMTTIKFSGEELSKKTKERDFSQVKLLGANSLLISMAVAIGYLLLAPIWTDFLHFPRSITILLISSLIISSQILHSWLLGFILAMQRFYLSGSINLVFGLVKLLIVSLIFVVPYKLDIAISSYPLATILASIIAYLFLKKDIKVFEKITVNFKKLDFKIKRFYLQNVLLKIGVVLLLNTDILLVNHFFDKRIAGIYGLLSMLGKMLFFVNSSFTAILIPMIASRLKDQKHTQKILLIILMTIFISSFGFILFFVLLGKFSLPLLFADKGLLILPYLFKYSLNIMILSLIYTVLSYQLMKSRFQLNKLFILGGLSEILLIFIFHQDIFSVINVLLAIDFTLLGLMIISYRRFFNKFGKKLYAKN